MIVSGYSIADLLGAEVIEDNSIVFSEQIRNAVDAGASEIVIDFKEYSINKKVRIYDNGTGMSSEEFSEYWNSIGNSKKNMETSLGGKGIGRFTLFRLSDEVIIRTLNETKEECYEVSMNKQEIEQYSDISEYTFDIVKNTDFDWRDSTKFSSGTYIEFMSRRNINFVRLLEDIESIFEPFKQGRISIKFIFPDTNPTDFLDPNDAVKFAPFRLKANFNKGIFQYINFKLYDINNSIIEDFEFGCEEETENVLNKIYNSNTLDDNEIDISKIGEINITLNNFLFDNKYIKNNNIDKNMLKKQFLSAYQGINIYRDGMKIFGHGKNDFLKLAEKRLDRSADNIDNKTTFGIVSLDTITKNGDILVEKTSREGFINNDFNTILKEIIGHCVSLISKKRKDHMKEVKDGTIGRKAQYINIEKDMKMSDSFYSKAELERKILQKIRTNISTNIKESEIDIHINLDNIDELDFNNQVIPYSVVTKGVTKEGVVNFIQRSKRQQNNKALLKVDPKVIKGLEKKGKKISELLLELQTLNIYDLPNATGFVLRSVIEISFTEFIKKNEKSGLSLKLHYDNEKCELVRKNKKNASFDEIVDAAYLIYDDKFCNNMNKEIFDDIKKVISKVNFGIHKVEYVMMPETLKALYINIDNILLNIWEDIQKPII